ncbi:MAG: allophanate hydrolase [Phycisphaerae bacterium]|nr:MAG: allophanate hydrolase [Phycisphaerae bacterium]
MTCLRVVDPGQYATVQDLGRPGRAGEGVPVGGAADTLSLRVANRLVGNPDGAAGVEMTLVGGAFEVDAPVTFALAGAPGFATIQSRMGPRGVMPWTVERLLPGEVLRLRGLHEYARAYLAVAGGVDVPAVLGGRGALPGAGLEGVLGRTLRVGDMLPVGRPTGGPTDYLDHERVTRIAGRIFSDSLAATIGPHEVEGADVLFQREFTVSRYFNRAGIRLDGPAPRGQGLAQSEGVMHGGVEVTPNGTAIILGPDAPVTGGYPLAACVIQASLPALGQRRAGSRVRFERVTVDEAWRRLRQGEDELDAMIPRVAEAP